MSRAAWPVAHGEHSTRVLQLQPSQPRGTTTWAGVPSWGFREGMHRRGHESGAKLPWDATGLAQRLFLILSFLLKL